MLIYIDPGHGGRDAGAVGGNVNEKDLALEISKKLAGNLEASGVKAELTRTSDADITLANRCASANGANADCFVSIHLNSNSGTPATGIETLVYSTGSKAYSLAQTVQTAIVQTTGATDRGVKLRPGLYVLKATNMPAILVETGFINNDADRARLCDPAYQTALAAAIAKGVCDWAGVAFSENTSGDSGGASGESAPGVGDMDGDGKTTVADVVALRKSIVDGEYTVAGDLDGDGKNTAADVVALRASIMTGKAAPGDAASDADPIKAAWARYITRIQAAVGVTQDGVAGAQTLAACPVLKATITHGCVSPVQEYVTSLGYDCGTADGVYGPTTAAAIRRFQKAQGITADGIVGKNTWKRLLNL
ncbi:MAG: N-acetylmuramoyl-L-alanine amidase [Candidatus Howiella sp.]|jgi:hypothetical protein